MDWKHTAEELYAHYNNTPNTHIARRLQALALLRRSTPIRQARLIQHAAMQGFRTLREAVAWCREALGVGLSERQRRRVLEQLGFTRKAPRPMAVRADAALQAQWKQGGLARR